ncbi:MAG: hypothetical protein K2L94_03800, partial [Alphaproteobacteria bacterium]|nr:hypothetical protein [Alphaproteobacteria bacterium]
MQKLSLFICAVVTVGITGHAVAVGVNCVGTRMCNNMSGCETTVTASNCQMVTTYYYNDYGIETCNACKTGYTRSAATISIPGCQNKIEYYICTENCTGCSNCTSDSAWSAHSTGYEKKVTRTCNCNTCSATTSYRCAAGYYGTSTNGTSGCTRCPNNGSSSAGTTSVTGCCIS